MKIIRYSALIIFAFFLTPLTFASRSEQVRMIKADRLNNDLIVERLDGQKWLIQHNRACNSMDPDFPLEIIFNDKDDDQLKVAVNEICKIYYSAPYSGEGKLLSLIPSKNLIIPDHEAKILWKDTEYLIDYKGPGCRSLYDFTDKRIYFSMDPEDENKGTIVLPNRMGQCPFSFVEGQLAKKKDEAVKNKLNGLDYQAQINQIYFYWEPDTSREKPLYAISYGRHEINPDDYLNWHEMPKARYIRNNNYTVRRLANDQEYHFYLTVLDENDQPGEWTYIKLAPTAPPKQESKVIEGEEEKFEITLKEEKSHFVLHWPEDPFARRYFIRLYVDGRQDFFKIIKTDVNEWRVPKTEAYYGKGLRFTVRTLPKTPFDPTNKDGAYWEYKK